jgi:protease-4
MGCTKIFAEPGTLTGSIGVVSGKLAMKGLYEKIGVSTDVISRGRNSGWMSSDEPFTTSEREVVTRLMQDCYRQFTEKAAEGRNMPVKELESLAGGRLYTGRMAQKCKLVDELGTVDDAIAAAKKMAGLKADDKVEQLILPKPRSFLEGLFGGPMVASQVKVFTHNLLDHFQQAETAVRLFREPVVLMAPVHIRVE